MTTTTTNYGFPKPAANEVGYATTFATAQDDADTAIKAAIDSKQTALSKITFNTRAGGDGLPSSNNGAANLKIIDGDTGYLSLSHYAYGSMIYFYDPSTYQLEIWGYDPNGNAGAGLALPVLCFRSIQNAVEIQVRNSADTDSLRMRFITSTTSYGEITTENNDTELRIYPKSANLRLGTANNGNRQILVNAAKTLEDNVATAICEIACAAGDMIGGRIKYTTRCLSDGGEYQSTSGAIVYAAVNKANTITSSVIDSADTTTACSDGTLTVAASVTNTDGATGKITIKLTANTSLTPTTLNCYYEIENDTGTNVTPV